MYDVDKDVEIKFPAVWLDLVENKKITAQDHPVGILLGGQPAAGKSSATLRMLERFNDNILVINGDEFRSYHGQYDEIYHQYGEEAAKYTASFAGKMVGKVRDEALKCRFNILIEGTFRTTEAPLLEIHNFKQQGYQVEVVICTCPKTVSWESSLKRAEALKMIGEQPRYVPKEHHDQVVKVLAKNVKLVFDGGKIDRLTVYSRTAKLFDSKLDDINCLESTINDELNGINNEKS